MDYIPFLSFLILGLAATVCFTGNRRSGFEAARLWMAFLFSATSILNLSSLLREAISRQAFHGGGPVFLEILIACTALAAAGWIGRWPLPRIWALPPLAVSACILLFCPTAVRIWVTWTVWMPCFAILAATVLLSEASARRRGIRILALGLLALAFTDPSGVSPNGIPGIDSDLQSVHPSLALVVFSLLRIYAVSAILVSSWMLFRRMDHQFEDPQRDFRARMCGYLLALILAVGWPAATMVGNQAETSWREQLTQEAMLAAAGFSKDDFHGLAASRADAPGHQPQAGKDRQRHPARTCWPGRL